MAKNFFAEEYKQYKEIESRFDEAKEIADEEAQEAARKEMKKLIEDMIEMSGHDYLSVFQLYIDAMEKGNEFINIDENGWTDKDPVKLVWIFREVGIEKFTFSSTWSGAVESAYKYVQSGCKLEGMVKINVRFDPIDGRFEKKPAFLFSMPQKKRRASHERRNDA